jgi:flavin-dependent dehydrogenase
VIVVAKRIAVVGASASGLYAASLLVKSGCSVTVYERSPELRPQPRTLIATDRVRDYLGPLGDPAIINEIHRFELFADGRVASVRLARPDLVIERSTVITRLADRARRDGVELLLGERFSDLADGHQGVALRFDSGRSAVADAVVGADGARSQVARAGRWPQQTRTPLVQAVVKLRDDVPRDTTRVWFRPTETPFFYWLIPQSAERAVVGLIGAPQQRTRALLQHFLESQGLTPLEYQASLIPLFTKWLPVRKTVRGTDVFLVGDAAGHVKVSTVGGLVTGFRGALAVAQQIVSPGSKGELRRLRLELQVHRAVRKSLDAFSQRDYVRLFDLLNPSAQRSLSVGSRDEAVRFICDLAVAEPRLLLLLARRFLMGRLVASGAPGARQAAILGQVTTNR